MRAITRFPARFRRLAAIIASAVVVLATVVVSAGVLPRTPVAAARATVLTGSQNNLRDDWDTSEPGLSPATLKSGAFGQLFSTRVNGQVYAQPVVAGSTVIIATENDYVYGLNRATGAVEWSDPLGPPLPASAQGCKDLTPNIGITSTPVYDPGTGLVYLVAVENDGPSLSQPHIYLYAVNAQTGAVDWRTPIEGSPVNEPSRPFNPLAERQRVGLLLQNGSVYAAFAGYCDYEPYAGYVAAVNISSKAVTLWTDEAGLTDREGGIWQSGGGLMSDGTGRIFLSTGNGVSPAPGPGNKPPQELGDSVVRLNVNSDGTMSTADFFSPANAPSLDAHDEDYGSGSPIGLPFGTRSYPHLLVQAGKDGRVFLLNRDNLGGREQGAGGTNADVSVAGPFGALFGHPAVFGDTSIVGTAASNDFVYYVGRNDNLRYLKLTRNGSGTPVLTDVATSTTTFGYSSGSPVVTSNGTNLSSAVVWEINTAHSSGTGATLEAYAAVPSKNCTGASPCSVAPIWSSPIGTASKFSVPATNDGIVYVGTRDGHVLGFGSPDKAPLAAAPVDFGQVTVGNTVTTTVTVTAATNVYVSAVAVTGSSELTAASPTPPVPVNLAAGQTLQVPVKFTPTAAGGVVGALTFTTNSANFPTVSVGLTGQGTKAGFYAAPASLSFGSEPDGTSVSATVTITNGGTQSESLTGTSPPKAPFSVSGLPAAGTVIAPGASVIATVTFTPTATGSAAGSFTVDGNTGNVTVSLSGTGAADDSKLTPTPTAISFGSVAMGQQATKTIQITNGGNLPATVKSSVTPTVPFGAPDPITAGLPVNPGYDIKVPITFTPSSVGAVSRTFKLTWTDVTGTHTLSVPVTGTGAAPASGTAVPGPGAGWRLNGSAQAKGTSLVLTQAVSDEHGSAVYSVPVASNGLAATFTARIGGGSGADGMTFSLLDASSSGPGSLGGGGGGLGFSGLHGVAVALDTYQDAGDPSNNFIGISTTASNGHLDYLATTTNVPNLRSGSHMISVQVSGQKVTVAIDGTPVLSPTLPAGSVPSSVLPAFTGATGGENDVHMVTGATITTGGSTLPEPTGGWALNGSAQATGNSLVLTQAVSDERGSAVYPAAVASNGLAATFTARIGGGSGADGMTFSLLDASSSGSGSLGGGGGGLGFSGLHGVAVALDTYQDAGDPSNNFIGISTGGGSHLTYLATTTNVPNLRSGSHMISVQVSGQKVTVAIDGTPVLSPTLPAGSVPSSVLPAFTGATGGENDVHMVTGATITTGGSTLPEPGGGWSYNSAARMSTSDSVLTPAAKDQAGSVIYPAPVRTKGLQVQFDAQISGGSGADGMTFSLLSPTTKTTAVGGPGGALGFGGLHGVAVALDTYKNTGDPSNNFAGISIGLQSSGTLAYQTTAQLIPPLRTGTHTVIVQVVPGSGGPVVVVWVDGELALAQSEPSLGSSALLAFTGGTGGATDVHLVRDVAISASS